MPPPQRFTMSELFPDPDLGPPLHPHLTGEQRIAQWIEMMEFADMCFIAGLEHRLQPGQTAIDAARESYERNLLEKDKKIEAMARRTGGTDGR